MRLPKETQRKKKIARTVGLVVVTVDVGLVGETELVGEVVEVGLVVGVV